MSYYSVFKTAINDSNIKQYIDSTVSEANIHTNSTITSTGSSSVIDIGGAKHVELLIYVTSVVGTPSVTFSVEVIEPQSGNVITSYDSVAITAAGGYSVVISESQVSGNKIRVSWNGTIDSLNYVDGVYTTLICKR